MLRYKLNLRKLICSIIMFTKVGIRFSVRGAYRVVRWQQKAVISGNVLIYFIFYCDMWYL